MLKELEDLILEDDDSEFGGVSWEGYTVKDFLEETELLRLKPNLTKEELNSFLEESGIKKI